MKNLLNKTTRPFLAFVLVVLLISVPVYYFVIEKIWVVELDEHNQLTAQHTAEEFNKQHLSGQDLAEKIAFWNQIQPGIFIRKLAPGEKVEHRIFTADRSFDFVPRQSSDNFRVLIAPIQLNGEPYYFRSITSFEDSRETVLAIAAITFFFFIIILAGTLLINRALSKSIWQPFKNTLAKLKAFQLNKQATISFEQTDITEFNELHAALRSLIDSNIAAYQTQKEFTENASHELQTPLAIIKNKLDILFQQGDLSEKQYQLAEEMNMALLRSTRINRNLVLLAKIDNQQYQQADQINLSDLLQQSINALEEHFDQKQLRLQKTETAPITLTGNSILIELLLNNLLLNAIRHSPAGGRVSFSLTHQQLTVSNTGEAALKEELLFKRFSRLSPNGAGSGLGLYIISEIAKFHHWESGYHFNQGEHHFFVRF